MAEPKSLRSDPLESGPIHTRLAQNWRTFMTRFAASVLAVIDGAISCVAQ